MSLGSLELVSTSFKQSDSDPDTVRTQAGHGRVSAWAKQSEFDVVKLWVIPAGMIVDTWPVTCTEAKRSG